MCRLPVVAIVQMDTHDKQFSIYSRTTRTTLERSNTKHCHSDQHDVGQKGRKRMTENEMAGPASVRSIQLSLNFSNWSQHSI